MKSVLISIQPKYCELIANGKKTIEVRKTRPKLETPFKCYIYCTKEKSINNVFLIYGGGKYACFGDYRNACTSDADGKVDCYIGNGKIIGEFVCDKIEEFYCASVPYQKENNLGYGRFVDDGVYKVDGWHEGVVFERNDMYIDTMLKNKDIEKMCLTAQELFNYIGIGKYFYALHISRLRIYDKPKELKEFFTPMGKRPSYMVERPPQSWQYVEELKEKQK